MYNKSAKLEYSRYIVFENIEEKSEEIQRCLEKIEKDVEKNVETLQNLDNEFMKCLKDYREKKETLIKCKTENEKAKINYDKILKQAKETLDSILVEDVNLANEFVSSENKDRKKDLNSVLTENGIKEKNPFDVDVISNSVNVSFVIYKKEIEIFLAVYERTKKLLSEIEENDVKLDKHKKLVNDSNVKLNFLTAEKDYIVGFLDNERIAAIYDKKIHRKLMLEACKNLNSDLANIDSWYDIILKEANSRSSKRLYKDNYNKSYLVDIEKSSEVSSEEVNKLKANAVAVMNLNYWRIEGIARIQEVFEKDVKEIYGRDIDEIFPKEEPEIIQETEVETKIKKEELEENNSTKKPKYKVLKSSKENLQKAINKLEISNKNESQIDSEVEVQNEEVFESETVDDEETSDEYTSLFEKISMLDELEEDDEDEESIFDFYFKQPDLSEQKRKMRDERKLNGDKKSNIFKKLIGVNSKSKSEA